MINQDDKVFSKNRKSSDVELCTLSSLLPKSGSLFALPAPGPPAPPRDGQSPHAAPLRSHPYHTPKTTIPIHFSILQSSLVQLPLCRTAVVLYLCFTGHAPVPLLHSSSPPRSLAMCPTHPPPWPCAPPPPHWPCATLEGARSGYLGKHQPCDYPGTIRCLG